MVLDNCMGSGTSGVACQNLGRNFIGIEKDKEIFIGAQERLFEAATRISNRKFLTFSIVFMLHKIIYRLMPSCFLWIVNR
jgi:DNA modification methylase